MKNLKPILVTLFVSLFAVVSVIHVNKTKHNIAAATPLEMIEVMTRAFDVEDEQDERSEGGGDCEMEVNNSDGLAIISNAKKNFWGTCKKRCDYICVKRDYPDIP